MSHSLLQFQPLTTLRSGAKLKAPLTSAPYLLPASLHLHPGVTLRTPLSPQYCCASFFFFYRACIGVIWRLFASGIPDVCRHARMSARTPISTPSPKREGLIHSGLLLCEVCALVRVCVCVCVCVCVQDLVLCS